jgi:hypothetical protein
MEPAGQGHRANFGNGSRGDLSNVSAPLANWTKSNCTFVVILSEGDAPFVSRE